MDNQCNTCGSFVRIVTCTYCPTTICAFCRVHHEAICEMVQKSKKRGEGPTVAGVTVPEHRAGHVAPPAGPPDRRLAKNPLLAAPYDPSKPSLTMQDFVAAIAAKNEPLKRDVKAMEALLTAPMHATTTPAPEPSGPRQRYIDDAPMMEALPPKTVSLPPTEGEIQAVDASVESGLEGVKDLLAE